MKRLLLTAACVAFACHRDVPDVPLGQLLWRLDAAWGIPPNAAGRSIRTAPATIVAFRSDGEFVELHCWLIEQPDTTVYISSAAPRVAVVGRWKQRDHDIDVSRTNIARTAHVSDSRTDPLCEHAQLTFRVLGNSVSGNTGSMRAGVYSPVTRLVSPDFESYVSEAKRSPVTCAPEKR